MVRSAARRCFSYAGAGQLQRHCAGTRPPRIVGAVFYQTTVREPRGWHDQRVVLRFDSATRKADVWVGDTHVAQHEGGYLPFEADVTDLVAPGEEVRITVRIDNRLRWHTIPPGYVEDTTYGPVQRQVHDFFSYAGIHRRVWLYSTPVNYLDDITVVTDIEKSEADAEVRGLVSCRASISNVHDADEYRHRALPEGFGTQTSLLTLRAALLGPDGTEAGRADSVGVDAKGLEYTFDIKVKNPILWELGKGGLYDLLIEVCDADDVIGLFIIGGVVCFGICRC
ncbi:sugar-binding domain-containing protein [Flaviflexus sp.]|uniref:sugar-binding domain-containing protein n=1 Tax=Flaviflexus sp. TaxID=1969482 RepID=UPI003F91C13A